MRNYQAGVEHAALCEGKQQVQHMNVLVTAAYVELSQYLQTFITCRIPGASCEYIKSCDAVIKIFNLRSLGADLSVVSFIFLEQRALQLMQTFT